MTDPNDLSTQLGAPAAGSEPRKETRRSILRKIAGRTVPTQVEQVRDPNGQPCLLLVERLRRDPGLSDEQAAALVRDARVSAALQHPNVVRGRAVSVRADEIIVASAYVEGETLAELWRALAAVGSSLPPDIAIRVLVDVLSGLEAFHGFADAKGTALNLIHGEVTAANVLIGRDGGSMLLHAGRIRRPGVPSVMDTGAIAPEIASGAPADRRADIFSVGVLLWQALSGVPALIDATDADLVRRIRAGTVERAPAPKGVRWGAALVDIAKRAMAPSAKDRYESAAAMAADLRNATGDELPRAERVAQYLKANMGEKNDAPQKPSEGTTRGVAVAPKPPAASARATIGNVPPAPMPGATIKPVALPGSAAAMVSKRNAPTPALGLKLSGQPAPTQPSGAPKPPLAPAPIAAPKPAPAPPSSITAPKPPPAPTVSIAAPKPPAAPTPPFGIKAAAHLSRAPAPPTASSSPARSLNKTMIGGVTAPIDPVVKPPSAPAAVTRPPAVAKPSMTPAVSESATAKTKQPPARTTTLVGTMSPLAKAPADQPPPPLVAAKPSGAPTSPIAKIAPPDPRAFPPARKDVETAPAAPRPPQKAADAVAVSPVLEIDGTEAHSVPPPPSSDAPYPMFPRAPVAMATGFTPPVSEHPVPQEPKVVIAAASSAGMDIVLDRDSAPPSSGGKAIPRSAKSAGDEPTVLLPRANLGDLDDDAPAERRPRRNRTIIAVVAAAGLVIAVLAGSQLKRKGEPARAAAPIATIETPPPRRESPARPTPAEPSPADPAPPVVIATPPPPVEPPLPVEPDPAPALAPEATPPSTHDPVIESPSFANGSKASPAPPSLRPSKPPVDVFSNEPPPPPPRPKFDPKRI